MKIGEILGPLEQGFHRNRYSSESRDDSLKIHNQLKRDFRLLAQHKDFVRQCVIDRLQADGETLQKLAMRINARATRRCGELLKEFEKQQGARTDLELRSGAGPKLTRKDAAQKAGLSKRQQRTAIRLADIPEEDFEAQIESDNPPTVTELAEQGTQKKPLYDLEGIDPERYKLATQAQGMA